MILVTGARGVVGYPLCQRLSSQAVKFLAVTRKPAISETSSVSSHIRGQGKWLSWDLDQPLDPISWAHNKSTSAQLTTLIHCAPLWVLQDAHIDALAARGLARIVAFSSTSIEGKSDSSSTHERELIQLLKGAEDRIMRRCQALGINLTILRPSLIYGFGRDQNVSKIAQTIRRFRCMLIVGKGSGLRQPVHADDLVSAALSVIDKPETYGKSYNVVGGETLSYRLMVLRIFAELGVRPIIISLPLWMMRAGLTVLSWISSFGYTADMANRMNKDLVYDCEAAQKDFNYKARAFAPSFDVGAGVSADQD
ncbi:MAG: NAD-dependent epimerase/dehydratase family protein [Arenicella sp.]|nr:NAD-dependent epimerase/dehydratase family protein [Arenicella sp.]